MSDDESGVQSERPLTDQERAEQYREQLKRLHVIDLVRDMMVTLVTVGYEKLGLTDQTRDLRDLSDARVAIESLRRLIEVVEGEGDPEAAALRSTLAQMQLNFARASAESRAAAAEPRTAATKPRGAAASSEAESRAGVEAEDEAQKAPSAQKAAPKSPARKAAAKKPASKPAPKKSAPKAESKKSASGSAPRKSASRPKRTSPKKPSGGATPGA